MASELVNRQTVLLYGKTIGFVFDDVPEHLKKPPGPGPFEQVPTGFSTVEIGSLEGLWWRVTPFNAAPWTALIPATEPVYPDGFIETFGPMPDSNDYHYPGGKTQWQVDLNLWQQNLRQYEAGTPSSSFDPIKVDLANAEAVKYEMGEASFFRNQYGDQVRFPNSYASSFQAPAEAFVNTATGQVIVTYQNKITNMGIVISDPPGLHPLAPSVLQKRQDDLRKAAKKAAGGV